MGKFRVFVGEEDNLRLKMGVKWSILKKIGWCISLSNYGELI